MSRTQAGKRIKNGLGMIFINRSKEMFLIITPSRCMNMFIFLVYVSFVLYIPLQRDDCWRVGRSLFARKLVFHKMSKNIYRRASLLRFMILFCLFFVQVLFYLLYGSIFWQIPYLDLGLVWMSFTCFYVNAWWKFLEFICCKICILFIFIQNYYSVSFVT